MTLGAAFLSAQATEPTHPKTGRLSNTPDHYDFEQLSSSVKEELSHEEEISEFIERQKDSPILPSANDPDSRPGESLSPRCSKEKILKMLPDMKENVKRAQIAHKNLLQMMVGIFNSIVIIALKYIMLMHMIDALLVISHKIKTSLTHYCTNSFFRSFS